MPNKRKKINLALQGGGAHGAFAWGVLDTILADGRLQIDCVSATSAGAMNAAVLAQGLMNDGNEGARKTLHNFWRSISDYGELFSPVKSTPLEQMLHLKPENSPAYFTFDMLTRMFSPYEFNPQNFNPLREVLQENVDFTKVRQCDKLKLFICATNVKTGKVKVFKNEEVSVDAILASACLPFLFQAIEVDGEYYWDGGYMGNPAIFPLIYNSDATDIAVIHINPIVREKLPTTATEIHNRINEISFNASLMREMRAIAFVTKMLDEDWIKEKQRKNLKRLHMHAIRADAVMEKFSVASKLSPDWDFLMSLFEFGKQHCQQWLAKNYAALGKKSTIDLDEFL